ncbi:zinc-dependent alcohol dehydrogenase [Xylanivirga thermophila]|uniref:zinc-dependent alcohol dehydrogenase n=1 Tax=Xylanivirga thermophila TaxID=2496273 RepID=UPI00101CBC1D|nr:alcohol dehydrogenase catalytic domain-containing protein [Xylanivirga thermophila]
MATKMQMAELELVDKGTPNSQMVAVLNKPFDISVHYAQIPEPNDDEIRIRIKWVGICGSDLEAFRGNRAPEFITTPARLGHEVAGIVDKVGKNVLGIKAGDRVTCRYVWGAYAQYIVCKPFNVKVMPKDFPMEAVSLIEVLPGIIHAAEIGKIDQTKNVLIMGQGVSGLIMTQVVKLYSPKNLVVTDLYDKKLELSKEYGATHTYKMPKENIPTMEVVGKDFPDGFDVVIPCLLEGNGMIDAIDCCSMGGRIVMYGCIGMCTKPIDFFKVHRKRIDIYSTEPKRDIDMRNYFEKGINMVLDGLVNTSQLVTHKIPLCRIDEAFSIRNNPDDETIHVLIDCEK